MDTDEHRWLRPSPSSVFICVHLWLPLLGALLPGRAMAQEDGPQPPPTTTTTIEEQGAIRGQVFERGTRDPLPDAWIEVEERVEFVDEEGRFELHLGPGKHDLHAILEGFRTEVVSVDVEAGAEYEVVFRLERDTARHPYETVIHGTRDEQEVTRISLEDEELRSLPGTMGDPFRAIDSLPGVVPVLTGVPYYFIRGAPPAGTGFYLDGVRVPQLFHLALGPAVIHPSLVDRIDFFPGGAPAEFGRYVGGIVSADTRLPQTDHWRSEWDLRLVDVGALVEVPLGDELAVAVSGRYSYSAWLIQLFDPDAYLQYWDYQARVEWEPARHHRLTLFGFGSFDEAGELNDDGSVDGPRIQFHRVDLRYQYRLGGELRAELGGWFGYDATRMDEDAEIGMWAGGPRASVVWSPARWVDLTFGSDLEARHFPPTGLAEYDDDNQLLRQRDALLVGAWAKVTLHPTEDTDLELGARLDVHRVDPAEEGYGARTDVWGDLRFSVRHRLTERLWLKGSVGTYHQPQSFVIDLPGMGSFTVDRGPQSAYQLSQGVEVALPWSLDLDVQVYYGDFHDLAEPQWEDGPFGDPVMEDPTLRDDPTQGWFPPTRGRSYGVEFLLRRKLGEDVFGWIAYTLGRSERDYRRGTAASDFDQTHVLNLVVSWNVGAGWRLGARFHLRSGRPYTPWECSTSTDPLGPWGEVCAPRLDARNEERLPPFYRLDLRVDKKWTFETWWFALYFEFINLTFTAEPFEYECSYGDEGPSCGVQEIPYIVIPTLGFKGVY
ncbi:MAG: TonB-dependent receptor [Deltaproteobacteria bacterium]|nr:TonB-dependent receptor [Deltaproteobacteria bacterium]